MFECIYNRDSNSANVTLKKKITTGICSQRKLFGFKAKIDESATETYKLKVKPPIHKFYLRMPLEWNDLVAYQVKVQLN